MPTSLRELRYGKLWTQRQLAGRAGISMRTIIDVEQGKPCRMATKRRLLRALGVEFSRWREVFPPEESKDGSQDAVDVARLRAVQGGV